jgi:hypothetical protein
MQEKRAPLQRAHKAWNGNRAVVEIANAAEAATRHKMNLARTSVNARVATGTLVPLDTVSAERWRRLSDNAVEPNGYFLPEWELAVNATAQGRTDVTR